MSGPRLLLIAGTHGNEVNAPWLFKQWSKESGLIDTYGIETERVLGNPEALSVCKRYLDMDLNRCFRPDLLESTSSPLREVLRARELLNLYGPRGMSPCNMAIDFHSTTSAMGSSVVIYGRRYCDLAFAALFQSCLGLPVYLHEGDQAEKGFLVEQWPCGLVIEIGPVPQMVLDCGIISQTRLVLSACFELIAAVRNGRQIFPDCLVVHRHVKSIDFPRDKQGDITSYIHPERQGSDWRPIRQGDSLFMGFNDEPVKFDEQDSFSPVFINEAAYCEKHIAMSLTKREVWNLDKDWENSLCSIVCS